ncbi:MAG: 50S ribosomal protein L24 [Planctomycetota bacterium]|jgi:large subunit ribosomal protein L24
MARIRKDDLVEVIAGNDRGKQGRVLKIIPKKDRVLVQGINLRWKHMRKSQQSPQGGRIKKEIPIHVSNVMPVDESVGTRTRVSYRYEGGKKLRVARGSGKEIGTGGEATKKAEKKGAKKAPKKAADTAGEKE